MYRTKLKVMGEVLMEEGASSQLRNSTGTLCESSEYVQYSRIMYVCICTS